MLIRLLSDGRARTVPAIAAALEVSERTVARDLDALASAGVPLTTTRGRHGGVALPRGWARLGVGLTAAEVAPLAALGVPGDAAVATPLATALAKIVAALPAEQRRHAEDARERLLLDPAPWWSEPAPAPHVERLREAVWADRRARIAYRKEPAEPAEPAAAPRAAEQGPDALREIEPFALVLKADTWYLVAGTVGGPRIFRCDRIATVELLDARFARPRDFDLAATWRAWCARFAETRPSLPARLRLTERGRARLAALRPASERAGILEEPEPVVDFHRVDIALAQLVLIAEDVEVLAPPALVEAVRAVGRAWAGGGAPPAAPSPGGGKAARRSARDSRTP